METIVTSVYANMVAVPLYGKKGYGERDILCGSYGRYGLDW